MQNKPRTDNAAYSVVLARRQVEHVDRIAEQRSTPNLRASRSVVIRDLLDEALRRQVEQPPAC